MRYYFIVRDWSLEFFEELSQLVIRENPEAEVHILTMHLFVKNHFDLVSKPGINLHYLPELLKDQKPDKKLTLKVDEKLREHFGIPLNRLYDLERFKAEENAEDFIIRHVSVLSKIFSRPGKLVALTMDHFVYILSGFMNLLQEGANYYVQPVGFPKNSYAIMNHPWSINKLFEPDSKYRSFKEYERSLDLHPKESVWYFKRDSAGKSPGLSQKISRKLNAIIKSQNTQVKKLQAQLNEYAYLDNLKLNYQETKSSSEEEVTPNRMSVDEIVTHSKKAKVFFYPLHLEPEMSILAYSPYFHDQLELIQLVSKNLKLGDILFIKENPLMKDRSVEFKKAVKALPNVFWVETNVNSRELIRNSFKVIGISGTALLEGAFFGVPNISFGWPPFYPMLIQKPLSEESLADFPEILYREFSKEEIRTNLEAKYLEYSRCILSDLVIRKAPHSSPIRSGHIENAEEKARDFYSRVLCAE